MRRFLIGMLLATTVASPLAAQERQWPGGDRREARQGRSEMRQNPVDAGQDRRAMRERRADVARDGNRGDWRGERQEARRDWREQRRDTQETRREAQAIRDGRTAAALEQARERARDRREERRDDRREDRRDWRDERRDDRRDWRENRRDDRRDWRWDDGRWHRDWRNDRRYDWRDWRTHNRDRFRPGRYYAPQGLSYRRWYSGHRIDPWFYSRSYWIVDPWYYRLPPAHGHYRWVRYYDDVMLVDIRRGIVIDIIYSFFW